MIHSLVKYVIAAREIWETQSQTENHSQEQNVDQSKKWIDKGKKLLFRGRKKLNYHDLFTCLFISHSFYVDKVL